MFGVPDPEVELAQKMLDEIEKEDEQACGLHITMVCQ